MIATLEPGICPRDAGTAVVSTNQEGRTTLLWNLVLYPPLGNYQQDLTYRGQLIVVAGSSSQARLFRSQTIRTLPLDSAQSSCQILWRAAPKLADGLTQLDNSTAELANGAAKLVDAQAQATAATKSAYTGSKGIATGTESLAAGLTTLSEVSTNSPGARPSRRGDCHGSARRCGECDRGGCRCS